MAVGSSLRETRTGLAKLRTMTSRMNRPQPIREERANELWPPPGRKEILPDQSHSRIAEYAFVEFLTRPQADVQFGAPCVKTAAQLGASRNPRMSSGSNGLLALVEPPERHGVEGRDDCLCNHAFALGKASRCSGLDKSA